ncbi:hypothetical protein QKU58_gp147 [Pyramimonas orientalis virus]|uniref:DUF5901 domain-containing protein n=1 Tax=Pyramimonas orientalis virus 01B TaxID=3134525 RepID=A0A7M4CES4_9VIRU|nr:hypothetical protein QKU58_gp147 [Pyramimonas orientalis virus]QOI90184.1 hypothetical protein HWQ62_00047 [Pyramimonas orientalis virus]
MPIEDIDFLYQNSTKENMIIFVDSAKRNKQLYPSPAEFQIEFTEPFNFVYGIEILDTTIPRTMFMIEENNNLLVFKKGFEMLNSTTSERLNLIIQDFSTAESFYRRMNSQFSIQGTGFSVDNLENLFDNTLYEERGKSDYPILRFLNTEPFIFDMKNSTSYNILGFDQYPKLESKYLTIETLLENPIEVNMYPLDDVEPFEYTPTLEIYQISSGSLVTIPANGLFKRVSFMYTHDSKYKFCSFLQSIKMSSNRTKVDSMSTPITISIIDTSSNTTVFEGLTNILFNTSLEDLILPDNVLNRIFPAVSNTQLVFVQNHIYEIVLDNVFLHDDDSDIKINLVMGFSYFINIKNLSINDKIFVSKPIYSIEESLIQLTNGTISYVPDNFETCDIENPLAFEISSDLFLALEDRASVFSTGTISKFQIFVKRNNDISPDEMFFLRFTRRNTDGSTSHLCELILRYELYDSGNNISVIYFENTNVDNSILQHTNLVDITNVEKFECQLFSKRPIDVYKLDDTTTKNFTLDFLFIKEYAIISPGMLNLASENYIILRCEEIENHLRGSYDVKDFSPGLGLLNIDVQGYASGRTEFFSVKYKEFHPIGKLNKMKFQFERKSDGLLYDFKNIDLHFLMSIKFLRPTQKQFFDQSVLNPNYNPNYLGYFNKTLQDLQDEDSSDEESDIGDEYFEEGFNDRENNLIHQFKKQY